MTHNIADDYDDDDIGYHRKHLTNELEHVRWDSLPLEAIIDVLAIVSNVSKEIAYERKG
jgi:hypothetical protein